MVEFSSVAMRILSPDGKTVLAELQTIDRAAVGTAARAGAAATTGIQQVQKQSAIAARQIAGNVAQIAAMGAASAESLKGIVTQGANIAFMFGAGGAIAGAIGLTGLAIANLFTRAREEMKETERQAALTLQRISRAGDIRGAAGRFGEATMLFSGEGDAVRGKDESDRAFEARKLGIQGIRAEIARLNAVIERTKPMPGAIFGGQRASDWREATDLVKEWNAELAKMVPRYEALIGVVNRLNREAGIDAAAVTRPTEQALARHEGRFAQLPGLMSGTLPGIARTPDLLRTQREWERISASIKDGLKKVQPIPPGELTPELERILQLDKAAESIALNFGQSLAAAIGQGVTAGLRGGIGDGFKALAGGVLQAMGAMFQQIGTSALLGMQFIKRIKDALIGFMPELGIPAAIGLIALGAGLSAAGASIGSSRGVGGGAAPGGFSSGATVIDRGLINPLNPAPNTAGLVAATPIHLAALIFGSPDDPVMQRHFLTTLDKAQARRAG